MVDETETLGGALEDVRAFCAVVEFGTVSAAARQLGETKGSISRRLSRLERRLGVTLLARTSRAVSPTEEGTAFYSKAREALVWLDDAAEGARQSKAVPRGHLRVTAPVDITLDVLPMIVVSFRALYPQISVELLATDAPLEIWPPTGLTWRFELAKGICRIWDIGPRWWRSFRSVCTLRPAIWPLAAALQVRPPRWSGMTGSSRESSWKPHSSWC